MSDERPVVAWPGRPYALAPLHAIVAHWRSGRVPDWRDDQGRTGRCGLALVGRQGLRWLALQVGVLLLRGLAVVLPRAPVPERVGTPRPGRTLHVVPILPDLSHTFVYREVRALLAERPGDQVLVLAQGGAGPVHAEAEALARRAAVLPRPGVLARLGSVLGWFLRAPRRVAQLAALYRPHGGLRALLGKAPLADPRHPGNAFVLADLLLDDTPAHLHVYSSTYATNVVMGAAILLDLPFSLSSYVDFEFPYDFKLLAEKYRLARCFRVCTRYCQMRMRTLVPDSDVARLPVVFFGLDTGEWSQPAQAPGRGVFVSAARLVPKKGLHVMPPALARLRARGLPFTWRVAGDGPELPALRALVAQHGIADAVEFLGPVANEQVRALLAQADAAVLPCIVAADGERDGVPYFFLEAMALGVPVVGTDVAAIPEVVRDGETGYLARPGDPESLAACLAHVIEDPARTRALAARGRSETLATLDVRATAGQLLQCLDQAGSR